MTGDADWITAFAAWEDAQDSRPTLSQAYHAGWDAQAARIVELERFVDEISRVAYPAHGPHLRPCACNICRDVDQLMTGTRSGWAQPGEA